MRTRFPKPLWGGLCLILIVLTGCSISTPTATPTDTFTPTPKPSSTPLPSPTPTPTPSPAEFVQEGDALVRRSNFAGAIEAYERAINIDETYGLAYSGLSMAYISQDINSAEALIQAQKGVDYAPESGYAHSVLAWAHWWSEAMTEAIESAEQAAELEPDNAFVQAVLARVYLSNNQFEKASQAAERAYEIDEQNPHALHALGVYYQRTADFGRALTAYETGAQLEPEFAGWQTDLGTMYLQSDRYQKATESFEQALELAPDSLPAILGLAYVDMAQKEFEAAEEHIEVARELAPEEARVYIASGWLYLEQEEPEKALEQFNEALDLSPDYYAGRFAVGRFYLHQDECEQARQQFQDLSSGYPTWSDPRTNRGWADICAGNLERAMTHFRDAVELDPYDSAAQESLAWGYQFQQRSEDASEAFVEAMRLSLAPSQMHQDIGNYFWSQGMMEPAETELKIADEINPYSTEIKLNLGEFYLSQERIGEAAVYAEEALSLEPRDKDVLSFRGVIYNVQDQPEEAVDVLMQALEEAPDDPLIHLHLGLAYRDLGDYSEAKKEIETYLALVGDEQPEDEINRLSFQIVSLDQGYTISQESALDDMEEFFSYFFAETPEILFEDLEDRGLTLVIEQSLNQEEVDQEIYFEISGAFAGISSFIIPRVDPPVDNGLLIRFTRAGKEWLTVEVSLLALKQWADTLIPTESLIDHMEYNLAENIVPKYSIDKMTKDLATLIELDAVETPPYQAITPDEVRDRLESSIDQEAHTSIQEDSTVLQLLGLISPTLELEDVWVDLYSEQIAGFYSLDEEQIYLVELEDASAIDQVNLAHEVVHALQDQSFGLEELSDPSMNDDQVLAADALIEGSATLASVFYLQEYIPKIILLESASEASELETEALEDAPEFISGMMNFPYSSGFDFVQALYERDEWETVNQAFTELPQSTEQILHPERYFNNDNPVDVGLPDLESALGDPWVETDRNVMGEYGLVLTLSDYLGPAAAIQAAEGWGGDTYLLLHNESEDEFVLVLQTTWDDQDEANDFWQLFRTAMYHRLSYTEIVESLIGGLTTRIWKSEVGYLIASQNELDITILIGSDLENLKEILTIINK